MIKEFIFKHILKGYLLRKYNAFKYRNLIKQTHEHYKIVADKIKGRSNKILRFASYVVYESSFGAYELMDLMRSEPNKYSAKIVICPDVFRGEKQMKGQYKKTKDFFVKKYGSDNIVDGYDENTETFIDVSDQFDVVYCANPYDVIVDKVHGVKYLSTRDVLPIYIGYAFEIFNWGTKNVLPSLEISLFWKVFAETILTQKDYQKHELIKGKNVVLTGYAKMDNFASTKPVNKKRKKIIIAPHHTVNNFTVLPLSNFLTYYNLILQLPKRFPDIDFVFRPHPLLFPTLINTDLWTKKMVDDYLTQIEANHIEYSSGGDYFDLFANSDAIIHDCGSFLVEWLYTEKPCCFVARNKATLKLLTNLGKLAIKYYTIAYKESDIISFIQSVNDNSVLHSAQDWTEFRDNVKINYPFVSKKIIGEISI